MCDGTGLTPKLGGSSSGGGSGGISAPLVTLRQLQRTEFQKDFLLIDIREKSQVESENQKALDESKNNENKIEDEKKGVNVEEYCKNNLADLMYSHVPMGLVLSGSYQRSEEYTKLIESRKKIAFLCPRGGRAQIVADWFVSNTNYDCYVLKSGIRAMREKFTTDDDWCAILTYLNNDPEKVGIALNLCNAAAAKGKSVTLVLMHEAVYLGTQRYYDGAGKDDGSVKTNDKNNKDSWELPKQVLLPKPFKEWKVLFDSLISKKGQILVCTSCLKKRGISPQNDLIKQGIPIRGPNIVDITLNSGFTMQFM